MPIMLTLVFMIVPVIAVVVVVVPTVIVGHVASGTLPITLVVALAVMMRDHPDGACIRRARPVPLVPFIMMADRIPVAFDPGISGPRSHRPDRDHAWRWGSPDLNSNGNLAEGRNSSEKHRRK